MVDRKTQANKARWNDSRHPLVPLPQFSLAEGQNTTNMVFHCHKGRTPVQAWPASLGTSRAEIRTGGSGERLLLRPFRQLAFSFVWLRTEIPVSHLAVCWDATQLPGAVCLPWLLASSVCRASLDLLWSFCAWNLPVFPKAFRIHVTTLGISLVT